VILWWLGAFCSKGNCLFSSCFCCSWIWACLLLLIAGPGWQLRRDVVASTASACKRLMDTRTLLVDVGKCCRHFAPLSSGGVEGGSPAAVQPFAS